MKFAMYLMTFREFADPALLADLAHDAEQHGWDGLFISDELALTLDGTPWAITDTTVALTAIAMRTERIRFGAMVTPVARRRPWKLARETAALDRLSNGRLTLAVGIGAPVETEYEAWGEDGDARVRAEKLDEGLTVLAGLWSGEPFTHRGKHYTVDNMTFVPPPVQQPRIPVWAGGWWPAHPPMRRAARWDGVFPAHRDWPDAVYTPDDYRDMLAYIAQHRTNDAPFDVAFMTDLSGDKPGTTPEVVAEYAAAGVTWWLQEAPTVADARRRIALGPPR